jgi:hypothetical protein
MHFATYSRGRRSEGARALAPVRLFLESLQRATGLFLALGDDLRLSEEPE